MAKSKNSLYRRLRKKLRFLKKSSYYIYFENEKERAKFEKLMLQYNDKEYVKLMFEKRLKRKLNLESPQLFSEKLQWLKLYYRDEKMTICADKYAVREYLKEKGYEHLLNKLYGVYKSPSEVSFRKLPDKFILKATHGSGWNIVCKNKYAYDWFGWKLVMKSWLKQNLHYIGREWVYDKIPPRIIIEEYLEDEDGELKDYKFFCFHGKPIFLQLDIGRFTNKRAQNFYDMKWVQLPLSKGIPHKPNINIPKPENFDEMKKIVEDLAKPFPFVRIDLYNIRGRIIFGEFTFFPACGIFHFKPEEYNLKFGEMLRLPEKNFNI